VANMTITRTGQGRAFGRTTLTAMVVICLAMLTPGCGSGDVAASATTASVVLPGGLSVSDAAVGEGDRLAAGYMVITATQSPDRLLAASSPAATRISVHTASAGGSMKPVDGLGLAVGTAVSLVPGGDHLMLEGLVKPLIPGSTVELDLTFESAGEVRLVVPVVALVDVLDVYDRGW
jgi:periplasmic copper chaperone A